MTDETAPLDPRLHIDLPSFAGPLDLLLHLIQKHELDILDLPVAFVTEKYLAYLELMRELDLDVAAEYLLMAATLAHIKSKMLLPPDPSEAVEEGTPEEELDPRAEPTVVMSAYEHASGREAPTQTTSLPDAANWRWVTSARFQQQSAGSYAVDSERYRLGRTQSGDRFDRNYYYERRIAA